MRTVLLVILAVVLSSCVGYRETRVKFVTEEEAAARDARIECRRIARNLVQIARCDGR